MKRSYLFLVRLFMLFLVVTFTATTLSSQGVEFPEFRDYEIVREYPDYVPDDLWDYINGAADAFFTYSFCELFIAEYVAGEERIRVEVYDQERALMAFGIYSFERAPDYDFNSIGAQGYSAPGIVNFVKDRYYVKISTNSSDQSVLDDLIPLAAAVSDALPGETGLPPIVGMLPSAGRVINGETYINESVMGHSFLRGALEAVYEFEGRRFTLYLFNADDEEHVVAMSNAYLRHAGLDEVVDGAVATGYGWV